MYAGLFHAYSSGSGVGCHMCRAAWVITSLATEQGQPAAWGWPGSACSARQPNASAGWPPQLLKSLWRSFSSEGLHEKK